MADRTPYRPERGSAGWYLMNATVALLLFLTLCITVAGAARLVTVLWP